MQRRERLTRSGAGSKKLPTCNFINELLFMKDVVINRKTFGNVDAPMEDRELGVPDDIDGVVTDSQTAQPPKTTKRSTSSNLHMGVDALIVKALSEEKKAEVRTVETHSNDAVTLFCLSMVDTLKALPTRKLLLAKMKINELLYNLTEDETDN